MELVYTDADMTELGVFPVASFDLEMGTTDSDFELIPSKAVDMPIGGMIYAPNTQFGGVVDYANPSRTDGISSMTYVGRSWVGLMKSRIVQPNSGEDYAIATGTVSERIAQILGFAGLSDIFEVETYGTTSTSYQCARYVTAYDALTAMLTADGLKLLVTKALKAKPRLSVAEPATVLRTDDYALETKSKCNHLICLGQGELAERTVVHLYADEQGNISTTQTITGIREHVCTYEYPNAADETELTESGTEEFRSLLDTDSTSITDNDGVCDIGDYIEVRDMTYGTHLRAPVTSIVLTIDSNGNETITNGIGAAEIVND